MRLGRLELNVPQPCGRSPLRSSLLRVGDELARGGMGLRHAAGTDNEAARGMQTIGRLGTEMERWL